jgi:hypothetical protein
MLPGKEKEDRHEDNEVTSFVDEEDEVDGDTTRPDSLCAAELMIAQRDATTAAERGPYPSSTASSADPRNY